MRNFIIFGIFFFANLLSSSCDYLEHNYEKLGKDINDLKKSIGSESEHTSKICVTISEKITNTKKICNYFCDGGIAGSITIELSNACPTQFAESDRFNLEKVYEGYNNAKNKNF
jgi:hypothetical protein